MLFYTINNLLILFWAAIFCFRKPSNLKNAVFTVIAFTQLLIIMLCRYQIGYDYNMYAVGFNFMNQDGFSDFTYRDWETGFVVMTKLLGLILPDYMWYMGVITFITIVPAAVFIYKNSEMPWVSTILYINLFLFFMSMNFLRQAIALSFVMIAWGCIKKNKFFSFLIVILIASLFHQTVLIMIPVYFLIKMQPTFKELIIYAYLLLWFYISSTGFINLITKFFHEEYTGSVFLEEGLSFIYAILPVAVTILTFILVKSGTINITKENKYIINLSLIGTIMMVTMSRHSIIERLSYYFILFIPLLVPVIYQSIRTKGIKLDISDTKTIDISTQHQKTAAAVIFLIVVLALSYFHFYYGLNETAHGVIPYDTWLDFSFKEYLSY